MPHDYKRALAEQLAAEGEAEVPPRRPARRARLRSRRTDLMGELGGFLRLERVGFDKRDPRERVRDYQQYFSLARRRRCATRAGAAWTAASRSATRAARSAT